MTRKHDEITYIPEDDHGDKYEAIARLASMLAHKINNPLTYMTNYLFILKQAAKDQKSLEMMNKIEQGVHKTRDLLQDLVDSAKPSLGIREDINIKGLLHNIISGMPLDTGDLIITMDIPDNLSVTAERNGIMSALSAITINAVESGTTELKFSAMQKGDRIIIRVRDKGRGIPHETIHRLFEPFYTTKEGHQGLELYRAHHIIKSHGGSINCRTWSNNDGAEFSIELPIGT